MAADALKILGSSNPTITTLTDIYTVPSLTSTTISTITICNRSATATTFRISVAAAGATDAANQYLYYDQLIDGNCTFAATLGITLATTDKIRVYAGAATLSFNIFGIEVS